MTQKRREKIRQQLRELNKDKACETCGKEHDHTYGTGRFCSKECACKFASKNNKESQKVQQHLKSLHNSRRSRFGTWKCKFCEEIFNTRQELKKHIADIHIKNTFNLVNKNIYCCPYCGKKYEKYQSLGGHMFNCKKSPTYDKTIEAHKKSKKELSRRYKSGEITPPFKNKKHSSESRLKMRLHAISYLESIMTNGNRCRYNKASISILEMIAKKHGWNIQHAENGGEFYTGIGYMVDAYDKEKNIVLEYDEPYHYKDVEKSILTDKDIERQNEIIEHLHCDFWRYNEKMKILWKAN